MFEFIHRYLAEHRMSPLIREIQHACDIASYKSAIDRLSALEHKGYIKRIPSKHRGIRIARRAQEHLPKDREPVLQGAGQELVP